MGIQTATPPSKPERQPEVPMPLGRFPAEVAHVLVKATKTGKVMFSLKWKDLQERTAWANVVVSPESPKAMEVFYSQMEALGLGRGFLDADETTPDDIAEALLGATATVSVIDEEWQGKTYRKVRSWF